MFLKPGNIWKETMNGLKYFIDTNIFLRATLRDIPAQGEECERFLKKLAAQNEEFFSSSLVLAEIAWTLSRFYKYQKTDVANILTSVLTIAGLKFEDECSPRAATELYARHNVKFADYLIASHPWLISGEMQIISYDRDFDVLGVKRVEPGDLI